jgi:integrase
MPIKRGNTYYVNVRRVYRGELVVIRKAIGPKKKDAVEAETAIKAAMAAGTYTPEAEAEPLRRRVLFQDFATEEYLPWSQDHHAQSHHTQLVRILTKHVIPEIGHLPIDKIQQQRIDDYCRKRKGARYKSGKQTRRVKGATVNRELMAIKAVFKKAIEWGLLDANPAGNVATFREAPEPRRLLSGDEIARFIEAMPDRLRALVAVVSYTGLRCSEVFKLRWDDIDWDEMELRVVNRLDERTKSNKHRQIPISVVLEGYIRQHPRHLRSPYVFVNTAGKMYTYNINREMDIAACAVGIPEGMVRLHQLRHAFCSHAQMQGVPARTVQSWMGHKSLATTLKYSHISPEHERAAIQLLSYTKTTEDKKADSEVS